MSARFIVGDVLEQLRKLDDASVDLVFSSPPFLALRSYLPADHPDKAKEMGSEPTPGDFIDALLDVTEECARVLAPHGSLCFELGDTYAGSGGAGGDYGPDGLRAGAPVFEGSAAKHRSVPKSMSAVATSDAAPPPRLRTRRQLAGWPLDKSLCLIPESFRWALAYGRNPFTGRQTEPWRVRNVIRWHRPNPPVGALGDKFRPATSDVVVACKSRTRYFDLDAVRGPGSPNTHARLAERTRETTGSRRNNGKAAAPERGGNFDTLAIQDSDGTAPPLDTWIIPTAPYKGSHYATFPPALVVKPVLAMCPERVCTVCGEPSRRITETTNSIGKASRTNRSMQDRADGPVSSTYFPERAEVITLGWTDCGHDSYRRGVTLDPFAGSGTVLAIATGHGRDAIGIDLDERNADLARERVGMFLTVERPELVA